MSNSVANDEAITMIGKVLNDSNQPLKKRFRALFTLRNLGGKVAIHEINNCFKDSSELLKHECAYVLGQMQDELAIEYLIDILGDSNQEPIVRHEAGEALGAIGAERSVSALEKFSTCPISEVCFKFHLYLDFN